MVIQAHGSSNHMPGTFSEKKTSPLAVKSTHRGNIGRPEYISNTCTVSVVGRRSLLLVVIPGFPTPSLLFSKNAGGGGWCIRWKV